MLPVSAQSPCGEDCEYDADFLALTQAAQGKPEQQFGDTVIAAVEPDWRVVEQSAMALTARTKDLRIAVWLVLAQTHLYGLSGFSSCLTLIYQWCGRYWDEVHPRLVIDGEEDPYLRMNALAALSGDLASYAGGSPMLRALRNAPLARRGFDLTLRDLEQVATHDTSARYSVAQLYAMLADAAAIDATALSALAKAAETMTQLGDLLEQKLESSYRPELSELRNLMHLAQTQAQAGAMRSAGAPLAGDEPDSAPSTVDRAANPIRLGPLDVQSRADARLALQRVYAYLERHEPSNPAALFARRAERLLDRAFLDIMQELAPDAMAQLETLTGAQRDG